MHKIRIGFIGLSEGYSWAVRAHLPALQLCADTYEISGLVNSSLKSAEASKRFHKLDAAIFENVEQMSACKDIDLIIVCVKVPFHWTLAVPAIENRKSLFVEWPLGNGLAEAEELGRLARQAGIRTVVGLQARMSPVINKVKEIVRSGALGTISSTSIVAASPNWGATHEAYRNPYTLERRSGANLLTIVGGHILDTLTYTMGHFKSFLATTQQRYSKADIVEKGVPTGKTIDKDTDDQILVQGFLDDETLVNVHIRGGGHTPAVSGFRWEIHGTKGDLLIEGPNAYVEYGSLTLLKSMRDASNVQDLTPKDQPLHANVLSLYQAFAGESDKQFPSFDDAIITHRLVDAVQRSSDSGSRVSYCREV